MISSEAERERERSTMRGKLAVEKTRKKKMEREHKPEDTRGFPRLEVFEKAATKKDDHNHPNSLQRVNYRNENINISRNMITS